WTPDSSARTAWSGKWWASVSRMARSAAVSASVTRSMAPLWASFRSRGKRSMSTRPARRAASSATASLSAADRSFPIRTSSALVSHRRAGRKRPPSSNPALLLLLAQLVDHGRGCHRFADPMGGARRRVRGDRCGQVEEEYDRHATDGDLRGRKERDTDEAEGRADGDDLRAGVNAGVDVGHAIEPDDAQGREDDSREDEPGAGEFGDHLSTSPDSIWRESTTVTR